MIFLVSANYSLYFHNRSPIFRSHLDFELNDEIFTRKNLRIPNSIYLDPLCLHPPNSTSSRIISFPKKSSSQQNSIRASSYLTKFCFSPPQRVKSFLDAFNLSILLANLKISSVISMSSSDLLYGNISNIFNSSLTSSSLKYDFTYSRRPSLSIEKTVEKFEEINAVNTEIGKGIFGDIAGFPRFTPFDNTWRAFTV